MEPRVLIGHLERFVVETRRAEATHWLVLAAGPFFVLWNPWGLALVMVAYAVVANVPCLLIQRYNAGEGKADGGAGAAPAAKAAPAKPAPAKTP